MQAKEFGEFLRSLREERGLTIRQVEAYSGVSNSYLSQVETGKRGIPSPEKLQALAPVLKIPYENLMRAAGYLPDAYGLVKDLVDNLGQSTQGSISYIKEDPAVEKLMKKVTAQLRTDPSLTENEKEMILEDTAEYLKFKLRERKKKRK